MDAHQVSDASASLAACLALEAHEQQITFRPGALKQAAGSNEDDDASSPPAPDSQSLTLGTAQNNQFIFGSTAASRHHARVVFSNNDFFLIDHSTNGTFVQTEDERVAHVHRDKIRLWGSGWISLGEPLAIAPTVHFRLGDSS